MVGDRAGGVQQTPIFGIMVFNCTLCGMGPRASILFVGIASLVSAKGRVLAGIYAILWNAG